MREIKFRVFDGANIHYINHKEDLQIVFGSFNESWSVWNQHEEVIDGDQGVSNLMQYTGLKDKNGTEIYEHDIVEFCDFDSERTGGRTDNSNIRGFVFHANAMWLIDEGNTDIRFLLFDAQTNDAELEIVGNVHEHPHLLEEST